MSVGPLFQSAENRTLPFKSWLPYDLNTKSKFYLSYAHQSLAIYACATINVAHDILIYGFMVKVCSQLQLLSNRILQIPPMLEDYKMQKFLDYEIEKLESKVIAQYISHHNFILRYFLHHLQKEYRIL